MNKNATLKFMTKVTKNILQSGYKDTMTSL